MDIKSKAERSRNMAAIRSENTKPEIYIRKQLFAAGFRYRLHAKNIPGSPDIFLRKYKTAIYVNGCFWHRHEGCKLAYTPKSNTEFWEKKFSKNIERDQRTKEQLKEMGLRSLVIWECTVRKMMKNPEFSRSVLDRIVCFLRSSNEQSLEI